MDVLEKIKSRRSVRKYKSDPIPQEDLDIILEAIRWAPSWANTQCWEVIIVTDREQRKKLSEIVPPKNPAVNALITAPVIIVMAARKGVSGYYKGKTVTTYGDWFMFDVALAMQNLVLEAHSRGLGTVDLGYFDHEKAARLLAIPEDFQVVAMTPLGYPAEMPKPPSRKSLTEFVSYGTFGHRSKTQ